MIFSDRIDAARHLARELQKCRGSRPPVPAIPRRGGRGVATGATRSVGDLEYLEFAHAAGRLECDGVA
jgi:predicted phosphoribosyltransferase